MTRTFGLTVVIASVLLTSPALAQNNEALRGKMAMSVYVSIYGDREIDAAAFRLSLEQQLHDMGITVLPHADPPNFPVLNLTINVSGGIVRTTTIYADGSTQTFDHPISAYSSRIEMRQLAPGRTPAMRPIEDIAIWSKESESNSVASSAAWRIPGDALDLAIDFVKAWQNVNGSNHQPTADKPMPIPNPNAPSPPSSEGGQSLYSDGSCPTKAGGGCVNTVSQGVTDSFNAVPNALEDMVRKQLTDLQQRGQKVITCTYGPINTQAKTGYVTFDYWYQSAPSDILQMLTSAFPHPFMPLGRVAVNACPATKALANVIHASRFN
ncbi:MAG TPA: hypothetical protein VH436_27265 [Vicinamibacterales bacterium]|jgi:hypothetical protein